MKVKELITQLLSEDMDDEVFVRVGTNSPRVDGISNMRNGDYNRGVWIEPDRELKDADD